MARPRLSDEHHQLTGSVYKSTAKTVSGLSAARPKMPSHLSKDAKREWKRVLPLLLQRGSLTDGDSAALALYVETHSRWLAAKRDVEQFGIMVSTVVLDSHGQAITTRKVNPSLRTLENCERSLRNFLREFGLTPATRERVIPAKQTEKKMGAWEIMQANKAKQDAAKARQEAQP